jgi:uncharacterized protein (UPF0179 family)
VKKEREKEGSGFVPRPSVAKCYDCPLKSGCTYMATVPKIQVFNLQQIFKID